MLVAAACEMGVMRMARGGWVGPLFYEKHRVKRVSELVKMRSGPATHGAVGGG